MDISTASQRLNTHIALQAMHNAAQQAVFPFDCIQSDHGPEFSKYFTTLIEAQGIRYRHSRVRKPNDNAHIERFNTHYRTTIRIIAISAITNQILFNTAD